MLSVWNVIAASLSLFSRRMSLFVYPFTCFNFIVLEQNLTVDSHSAGFCCSVASTIIHSSWFEWSCRSGEKGGAYRRFILTALVCAVLKSSSLPIYMRYPDSSSKQVERTVRPSLLISILLHTMDCTGLHTQYMRRQQQPDT